MSDWSWNDARRSAAVYLVAAAMGLCACASRHASDPGPAVDGPRVLSVTPSSAMADTEVVLAGAGFGNDLFATHVCFGDAEGEVVSVSPQKIHAVVPLDGMGDLTVSVGGEACAMQCSFTYIDEELLLDSFTPESGPPGTWVTLHGAGFGRRLDWLNASLGASRAPVMEASGELMRVLVPADAASGPLTIRRGRQECTSTAQFTIAAEETAVDPLAPQVWAFEPSAVYPRETVTVYGTNFGTDPAAVMVYAAGSRAEPLALANGELTIAAPFTPGEGPVAVTTPNGTGLSADSLRVLAYPDYFARVTGVDAERYAPGGIIVIESEVPDLVLMHRPPVLGGQELAYLGPVGGEDSSSELYRLPPELEGTFYLGIPNLLGGGDQWVTAYYLQPLTLTTEGMSPPQPAGLVPDGLAFQPDWEGVQLEFSQADFTSPLALTVDGELAQYYDPEQATADEVAQYEVAAALPFAPQTAAAAQPGQHGLLAISREGYGAAPDGYYVLPEIGVRITVDGISTTRAAIGDIVTLTGENLFWTAPDYTQFIEPMQVWVGDAPMPVIPVDFSETPYSNELLFIVTDQAYSGEVRVTFQTTAPLKWGIPVLELDTGFLLEIEDHFADTLEKHFVEQDVLYAGNRNSTYFIYSSAISPQNEIWLARQERVAPGEHYFQVAYLTGSTLTDGGRIAQAPEVFPGFPYEPGPSINPMEYAVHFAKDGSIHFNYYTTDRRPFDEQTDLVHYEQWLTVIDGSSQQDYSWLLYDSETGLGSEQSQVGENDTLVFPKRLCYDESDNLWAISDDGLIRWSGDGWEDLGAGWPEVYHPDPVFGDVLLDRWLAWCASSAGVIKAFVTAREPVKGSHDTVATYLLTRSPAGEWSQQQVLDRLLQPVTTFDRQCRGRLFTSDDEKIYIYREEDGFAPREWLKIPYPANAVKPITDSNSLESYYFGNCFKVGYTADNRLVGYLNLPLAPDWDKAFADLNYDGAYEFNSLLFESPGGKGVYFPLSIRPTNGLVKYGAISGLDGITVAIAKPYEPQFYPTGPGYLLSGDTAEYTFEINKNVGRNIGVTYYLGEAP